MLFRSAPETLSTPYHSKYWAAALTLRGVNDSLERLSGSIASARVDLNPHQVDAALFALRSPLSKGVILADEVGLGKTIEAGIVISQRWAERRRKILLILPATLRKQGQQRRPAFHPDLPGLAGATPWLPLCLRLPHRRHQGGIDYRGRQSRLVSRLKQQHSLLPLFTLRWLLA